MKTTYRAYTSDDIDQLVDFWNENAGWDVISRNDWERRFYHTPFGPTSIILALEQESQEIVGQFMFIPTTVAVDGQQIKAFRPFAPVLKKSLRTISGMLPSMEYIRKMYNFATKHFVNEGVSLIYIMPDPRWARLFYLIPGATVGNFPLWTLKQWSAIASQLPEGYSAEDISPDDSRLDELWNQSVHLHGCSIVRNSTFLPWKLSHHNYQLTGITHNHQLIGFSASLYKHTDKQWLICDVVARNGDEALRITLQASCARAALFRSAMSPEEQGDLQKVAILATPLIERVVAEIGFEKDNYKFPLVVHALDGGIPKKDLAPERWYVSAND